MLNRQVKRRRDIYMFDGGPGRQYIGQTVGLEKRNQHHRYLCSRGKRYDLYNAVRKDPRGWAAFPLRILAYGWWTDEQADAAESGYIAYHDTFHNGLNMTKGGEATTGWVPSQETRDKISASNTGKPGPVMSADGIARIRAAHLGKVVSEESKEKNRQAHLGKKDSAETRAKKSASTIGKAKSEQHNARVSATHKARGISFSDAAKEKALAVNKGRKVPAQDRFRMGGVGGAEFREANIDRMLEMRSNNKSMRVIAEKIGVAECTISRWIRWHNAQKDSA